MQSIVSQPTKENRILQSNQNLMSTYQKLEFGQNVNNVSRIFEKYVVRILRRWSLLGIMATSCSASGYTEPILLHILATYMCPQAYNPANTCPYNLNVLEFNGILAVLLLPTLLFQYHGSFSHLQVVFHMF